MCIIRQLYLYKNNIDQKKRQRIVNDNKILSCQIYDVLYVTVQWSVTGRDDISYMRTKIRKWWVDFTPKYAMFRSGMILHDLGNVHKIPCWGLENLVGSKKFWRSKKVSNPKKYGVKKFLIPKGRSKHRLSKFSGATSQTPVEVGLAMFFNIHNFAELQHFYYKAPIYFR